MLSLTGRPRTFEDIAGHKAMVQEFQNRAKAGEFPQVMIFEGSSGTGKTSLALIIASLLNCESPVDGNPCGQCKSCQDIHKERFNRDVTFLDASTMGKDDVLKLQETVSVSPMWDDNKVIIIDEAQELSKAGKGATLKLLEKPRDNVYFILCTMDEKALDKSVKSRGQTYLFKTVNAFDIAEYLYHLAVDTDMELPEEFLEKGIFLIAENSMGNVREAVQLLERCVYGEYFTEDKITSELGVISFQGQVDLLSSLLKCSPEFLSNLSGKDEVKKFFYYSWKILLDAMRLKQSGYVDQEWKRVNLEKIADSSNLKLLLDTYNAIYYNHSYFNTDNVFWHFVFKYYEKVVGIPMINKKETPKRATRKAMK